MTRSAQERYTSYFRPGIDAMSGYTPGEQPKVPGLLKLNTNESPYPPSPGVKKAFESFDNARLRLYPDPVAQELREYIGGMFDLPAECVIAGNGSDDILNIAIRCFCDAERPAACLDPSYSLYPTLCGLQGAECIRIPLNEDFSLPVDLLAQANRANLLLIARPNAPTGNSCSRTILAEICRNFQGIVLIDEAYADFAADNCADFASRFSNVIVCRTFSKSRNLAGLRFGFALAHPKIIEGLMKMKDSYNVSMLTQVLALASLKDPAYFADCLAQIRLAREMLTLGLYDLGFRVVESETNFVFASPPDGDGRRFFEELRKRNILVRYFPGPVTGKWVRITVGTTESVSRIFLAAREIYREFSQDVYSLDSGRLIS